MDAQRTEGRTSVEMCALKMFLYAVEIFYSFTLCMRKWEFRTYILSLIQIKLNKQYLLHIIEKKH